jgi:1-acyl-sn-glycerol-3-phosphate acyltransferase
VEHDPVETWPAGNSVVGAAAALGALLAWLVWTLALLPVQIGAVALDLRLARRLPMLYHRGVCRLFGLDVRTSGAISPVRPTLFVANHSSYLDIPIFGGLLEVSFIAKAEVRSWPLLGLLARLQNSVFVDRRLGGMRDARAEIARRLALGDNLMLFPEGTTSDGNRVLDFYTALFGLPANLPGGRLLVQPVTLAYTRQNGMPIGHVGRSRFAWVGETSLARHFWRAIQGGRITVEVRFHEPVEGARFASRKALSQYCFAQIACGLERALRGGKEAAAA